MKWEEQYVKWKNQDVKSGKRIKVSKRWTNGNHSESFVNSKSEWWAQHIWKMFLKLGWVNAKIRK